MMLLAKAAEALGIACVMIGLVQGLLSSTMWTELYLSLIGVAVFLVGRRLEKHVARKTGGADRTPHGGVGNS